MKSKKLFKGKQSTCIDAANITSSLINEFCLIGLLPFFKHHSHNHCVLVIN